MLHSYKIWYFLNIPFFLFIRLLNQDKCKIHLTHNEFLPNSPSEKKIILTHN